MTSWSTSTHMLLVVDNHDSFTWNLVHALARFAPDVAVVQGDEVSVGDVLGQSPRGIVLTPGPGRPEHAGVGIPLVQALGVSSSIPLLGVCLGHQIVCTALGARVVHADRLMHGRGGLFVGLPPSFEVARYHSLIVDAATLPPTLIASAHTDQGELMAVRHVALPIESVQFHPESFMTEHGLTMVRHFVERLRVR